jgi:glycosyltransferase involved in cell wall biosynthesis
MRVIVHDFSGHPFQAELARSLARRGHQVLHAQCTSYTSGKGSFGADGADEADEDENPRFVAITLDKPFERYRTARRLVDELVYSRAFVKEARAFRPDLVISCNDPLLAKLGFGLWAARRRVPWIFWLQDIYSVAMAREAARRSRAGRALGAVLKQVERGLLRSSDAVVAITDDFDATLDGWGVAPETRTVIENWAPLDELPPRDRDNPWRKEMGFGDRFLFLYAGTLGMKHNPDVLHALAEAEPTADVVVVSEGMGAERLQALLKARPLDNLHLLPFQPWEALPDVLGAADVLMVLLEAGAGAFSVPSKILTCLCAGRPILAAVPAANLGARTIRGAEAGLVVAPGEPEQFLAAARQLRTDAGLRGRMGASARSHAEQAFDIEAITDRFTDVMDRAVRRGPGAVV